MAALLKSWIIQWMLDLKQPLFRHKQLSWQGILSIILTYFLASSIDNYKTKPVTQFFFSFLDDNFWL